MGDGGGGGVEDGGGGGLLDGGGGGLGEGGGGDCSVRQLAIPPVPPVRKAQALRWGMQLDDIIQ